MVVIDKLSKSAQFITVKSTFKAINIVEIFMKEIFRLHGIPKMVNNPRYIKTCISQKSFSNATQ
jgi:hypothetical protein